MSYRIDLDEYDEDVLHEELRRRKELRDQGLCDYCERESSTRDCKFPQRHYWNDPSNKQKRLLLDLLPFYDVKCLSNITQAGGRCINFIKLRLTRREKPGPSRMRHQHSIKYCTDLEDFEISPDNRTIAVTVVTDPTR